MKLIIMKGLPASGKSTKAEEIVKQGNTVRLNKDLLRTMLHFDKFTGKNEGMTRDASRTLAKTFLSNGTNVIIDDTNLNPSTVQSWVDLAKEVGAKIEYQDMTDVPVEECIKRDRARDKKVGRHVIQKMALQYLNYYKGEKVVICDLDGTLCDIEHRRHFVQGEKKDWKGFFEALYEDTPRKEVVKMLVDYKKQGCKVVLVSARPEDYRKRTEEWLERKINPNVLITIDWWHLLIMRESGDKRPDTEVKAELYEKYLKNMNILKVIDDRPSVIRMWREKGLDVEDVGNGEEF